MLPEVKGAAKGTYLFKPEDAIEGWALSMDRLIQAHFNGSEKPVFDLSNIRPKGAYISGGFKAPGPEPLKLALDKVDKILQNAKGRKLRPFEAHLITCIIADAVVSGGVRRSALLCLFDADDSEMRNCKTGDWYYKYPELARANNSIVILPETPVEVYDEAFESVRMYGEPGFAFLEDPDYIYNPCVEIGLYPKWINEDGSESYGWAVCNLTEINGKLVKSEEDFIEGAEVATILGTIQASYTDFPFLGEITEKIVRRDSLIGVSITGMCENPKVLFNEEIQSKVAKRVVELNKEVSSILNINPAVRTTCIKPSGNASQMLGTAPGIHPFHSYNYIRNVQVNKEEQAGQIFKTINPVAVEDSLWGHSDYIISFPISIPKTALVKDDLTAIQFLENVKNTQKNWVLNGTNKDHPSFKKGQQYLTHNVSNTVSVLENEWDEVKVYLWKNRHYFTGVSLLPASGDLNYVQAPYSEVLDEVTMAKRYKSASILAGGLIVDGLHAFNGLWRACDTALGRGEKLVLSNEMITKLINENLDNELKFSYMVDGVMITDVNALVSILKDRMEKKKDWVRRFKKFAKNYLNGNLEDTAHALKRVSLFHQWHQLHISHSHIPWDQMDWQDELKEAGSEAAIACAGGACLL